jgi:hypothetical protein
MSNINNGVLDGTRRVEPGVRGLGINASLAGAPVGMRLRGATQGGAPAVGSWKTGDQVSDQTGVIWICTAGGSPGTWVGSLPQSQSFALANNTYQTIQQWTVTGQTDDPLPPFALVAESATYGYMGTNIQGPIARLGYNVNPQASGPSSVHGTAMMTWYADAGDTNNGAGGHGLECNISFATPGQGSQTNAFEMVAVDDTTNTVSTWLRCGTGTTNGITSNIVFQNANGSTTFCTMSNANSNVIFSVPTATFTTNAVASKNYNFSIVAAGTSGQAVLTLNGAATTSAIMYFEQSGTAQWAIENSVPNLQVYDMVNSRNAIVIAPGTTTTAKVTFNSNVQVSSGSLIVGNAALATTATTGFLYLPSCAGAPTGTPTANTGTVPFVFDTTDNRLYFYQSGAWEYIAG